MSYTKRPHKKTRTGCQSCRDRRVKCDESRPKCTSCKVRNIGCEYPLLISSAASTASNRKCALNLEQDLTVLKGSRLSQLEIFREEQVPFNPPVSFPSQSIKLHDMRLLHHYCTVTVETLGSNIPLKTNVIKVWGKEVPQLAFQHEFLLDNLLALASAHMDHMDPGSANYELTAFYQDKALRVLREAVAKFSKDNFLAVIAACALLSPLSLVVSRKVDENRLWSVDWLVMHSGFATILRAAAWQDIIESCLAPIFDIQVPDPAPNLIPNTLMQMFDSITDEEYDASFHNIFHKSIICLGGVYGRIAQTGQNSIVAMDIMRWPFEIPSEFRELAKQQVPCALVILAHFIILFKFLSQTWWISNVAEHDIEIISRLLEPRWHPFLTFPKAVAYMTDQDQILKLFLSQLP